MSPAASCLRMMTLAAKDMKKKKETMKRRKKSTWKSTAELVGEDEELSLQVIRMGNPRLVECNLVAELDASADDGDDEDDQGVGQMERPPFIPRATRNADTPSANKVLARLGEEMRTRSEWMMMFAPVAMAQATWPMLGPELTQPINSTGIKSTVLLLKVMGYRCNSQPNSLIQLVEDKVLLL
ncbi:unnamed protein product [Phytophthora fragariaefolia]|uniref:Unnamed protein product n=1 Tax=Phytophthora fragariaefolia TaxID=1490495 RepID=A0A9W6XYW4_9STRA|nr:unnamed protein product [Phytophthora fragariaefolia]